MKILSLFLLAGILSFPQALVALEKISPSALFIQESGSTAAVNPSLSPTFLTDDVSDDSLSAPDFTQQISELCSPTYTADNQDETTIQLYENFFAHYLDLAELGQRNAEFYIGRCYETGTPFGKNWELAAQYYLRAAEKDHLEAQAALSRFLKDGKALYLPQAYLQKAATDGDQAAINALNNHYEGVYLRNGEGEIEYWEYEEEGSSEIELLSDGDLGEEEA
ncbi:tetratricopeptide repeat protein [Candidatus Odyssella acanthamoebae]|uniref:Sel1 repeat family protein n=1 Tax=Candidatus Odyssella acanthamoebae TaxID=91604 RepID=A0A077AVG7_9PROT|nr:sel1 repeat family protein [Candidatus Paracaedibacter acanthamoebae]AIK97147.1 hypothetical protein ID47_11025 [Candidatus Paracaedibacter acanthamoebae]